MAVYVDSEGIRWRGREWCHLVADSLDELHTFADRLGLKRSWFQSKTLYPHYDVTKTVRTRALALGAQGADRETIVSCARRMRSEMIQLYRATAASA
ncbi:DUF4031 domain-containing protein [Pseudomonas plecoglossicida]|uniref:DUF4031 domain-containing protein n=2 Tax=Pseudomonas putida group TaxID=136845 RepID=A0A2A3M618_PSEDL|nr:MULTISPECIES: DUF4031 domain-containing protein [Pseudomonas]AGA76044.1 hypothetical protein B479_25775 [Pseudomonas putida HB3267]MBA1316613.1 DUF4031 domain-containing protein [Pseudomonas monteilii]MBA6063733.1 DUF4031 domain-containing protein [Pseudomonas mosselii]MBH3415657.1 DUF4031 domain-containing protein [Pseudomonas putida]MBO2920431.1 DUF4031 domain-containing protein [Pseudomonas asiatica]